MHQEDDLEQVRNEVLRRIGRNVLRFQEIENKIKFILIFSSSRPDQIQVQLDKVKRQTLGTLIDKFLTDVHSTTNNPEVDDNPDQFNFKIRLAEPFLHQRRDFLERLVDERNDLIHHFLPRFDPESVSSCKENLTYLDTQHESLQSELVVLNHCVNHINDMLQSVTGEEGVRLNLAAKVLGILWDVASRFSARDGWTSLTTAEQLVKQTSGNDLKAFKKAYRVKTLREYMETCGLFDIRQDLTKRGGIKVLYRIKPHFIESQDEGEIFSIPSELLKSTISAAV